MDILNNINALNIDYDNLPKPGGSYEAVNIRGKIAWVAIQFPFKNRQIQHAGRLGVDISTDQGYEAAGLCALNIIGQIQKYIGFEKIEGLNHLDIYFQNAEGWSEGPAVANGASDLFNQVLGDAGKHSRTIVGVHSLSRNSCIAITSSFTLK
ncbi:MAG: RidA family protein [Pedobacter sp.]|jgi:enamine deaminase RidA (YjgF/YER057c/UK114 family)